MFERKGLTTDEQLNKMRQELADADDIALFGSKKKKNQRK